MVELRSMQCALIGQVGMGGGGGGQGGVESGKFSIIVSQVTAFIFCNLPQLQNDSSIFFNISDRRTSLFPERHNQRLMTVSSFCCFLGLFFDTPILFLKFEG